jgi:hypothetical protein
MTTIQQDDSWKNMLSAALDPCKNEPVTLYFSEDSNASRGVFEVLYTSGDDVIVSIPKDQIDQVLAPHVNLNRH